MSKTFLYHKPGAAGLEKITELRRGYTDLQNLINQLAPASRERAVALTELETSAMWAIKSVVTNDPESQAQELPASNSPA
jgi:hypothetical protein